MCTCVSSSYAPSRCTTLSVPRSLRRMRACGVFAVRARVHAQCVWGVLSVCACVASTHRCPWPAPAACVPRAHVQTHAHSPQTPATHLALDVLNVLLLLDGREPGHVQPLGDALARKLGAVAALARDAHRAKAALAQRWAQLVLVAQVAAVADPYWLHGAVLWDVPHVHARHGCAALRVLRAGRHAAPRNCYCSAADGACGAMAWRCGPSQHTNTINGTRW
jgi:hypothetical protein